ncbi:MAG TPA: MBL fold metallo-hydrolase [Solirubrobacteraceae bacterium]|nr:MBL fold metallo-hydrolase [Solirubrobacteraceae bacterium]
MPGDGITYVGHATTLIDVDGARLLTDPVLTARIGHIRRIVAPPAGCPECDAVLISHAHHDHLHVRSLRRVPAGVPVIAPAGSARVLRRWTGHDVVEVAVGASVRVGATEVVAIPAAHDGRRLPVGPPLPTVGYLVSGTSRVAFYGDTDVFDGMADIAGDLDVALLPIWGWGPRTGPGHMDPERAAQAAALLAPRVAVPIHWGTLAGPRVWWRADPEMPARLFAERLAAHAPAVAPRILAPGERLALTSRGSSPSAPRTPPP